MAFCRLVFPLLVLSVVQIYANVRVPVFMWGDLEKTTLKSNPLKEVTFNEFNVALKHELKNDPFTVIFIEETLSVEDLSSKNDDGETSFPYLRSNIADSLYLPTVESPLRVLNKLADPEKVDHVKLTENGVSAEIEPESGKFLFINLKDAKEGETRSDFLRRHNDFMEDMFTKLQEKYDSVIAIYMAHYPSWTITDHSRVRRQTETRPMFRSDIEIAGLRLYYKNIILDDVTLPDNKGSESVLNVTAGSMNSTLYFDNNNVTMNFVSRGGYWLLNTVSVAQENPPLNEELTAQTEVYALIDFSYRCAENVTFGSTVNQSQPLTLVFQDLKVQPFFNTNTTGHVFGDTFNCSGFFTAPIWSGIFVVFILLSITFYGMMMIMDIRTMDRFDDPKGKTITINAE